MIRSESELNRLREKWEPYVRHILGVLERIESEEKEGQISLDKNHSMMVEIINKDIIS
jgi:hypothetical protein